MGPATLAQLVDLAGAQFSLFSVAQASSLGITPRALEHAVERGYIYRYRRGVYAFGGHESSRWCPLMAAALAAGPHAVVSHSSAAAIHGFYGVVEKGPELTVPMDKRVRLQGVRVHRSRRLGREDVYLRRGLRVTRPIRTVIDIAARMGPAQLATVIDEGSISRLWTPERVLTRLEQMGPSGRAGIERLRRLLAQRTDEGNPANGLEQRVMRVLKGNVPPFHVHYLITLEGRDIEMDLAWPDCRVGGEVEGRWVRATSKSKFDRDKRRANLLAAHGWRLVYFTSDMSDKAIVAEARRALSRPV